MAYVKTHDGQAQAFPYTIGDLRKDNPQTSFPRRIPDDSLSAYGVFEVAVDTAPAIDEKNYRAVRSETPVEVSGKWVLQWSVVEKTAEEKQKYYDGFAQKVRSKRNALLSESDWVVVFHAEKGASIPVEWEVYRQALRDITGQAGFPYDVTWPEKPSS